MQPSRIYLDDAVFASRLRREFPRRQFGAGGAPYSGAAKPRSQRSFSSEPFVGQGVLLSRPLPGTPPKTAPNPSPKAVAVASAQMVDGIVMRTPSVAQTATVQPATAQGTTKNVLQPGRTNPVVGRPQIPSPPELSVMAKQFAPRVAPQNSKTPAASTPKQKGWRKVLGHALTGFSLLVLMAGSYVVTSSYFTNKHVAAQVQQSSSQQEDANNSLPSEEPPSEDIGKYAVAADMPKLVSIQKLGVKARVRRMGVDKTGAIQAPRNIYDAGWYDGSAKPGEPGTVFLDAHVSGPTKPGVFHDIKKLAAGDTITIEMGDGKTHTYSVVSQKSYPRDQVNMQEALVSAKPGKRALNMMTCSGKFDSKTQSYSERLVVFAVEQ